MVIHVRLSIKCADFGILLFIILLFTSAYCSRCDAGESLVPIYAAVQPKSQLYGMTENQRWCKLQIGHVSKMMMGEKYSSEKYTRKD